MCAAPPKLRVRDEEERSGCSVEWTAASRGAPWSAAPLARDAEEVLEDAFGSPALAEQRSLDERAKSFATHGYDARSSDPVGRRCAASRGRRRRR